MRYKLQTFLAVTLVAPILIAWAYLACFPRKPSLPKQVVEKLEKRFDGMQNPIGESDVLKALKLDLYPEYLQDNFEFMMGGGGCDHKIYTLSPEGHRLEFRDFMGNFPECLLHLPGAAAPKTIGISETVSEMPGFHEFLNPDL